ncbi:zinc finger protein with KRAB and SCAN domains 4-like [Frankliniella occidentalis]|uniref:Zinc finger protein with KRAB and SCAN domains 4-like n=1 Tax=Frankliniella occidentalis TaxID=133901 RepID=A0A9C6U6B8_FRAOC|nr:zinc finger protein with KRAB and SCAN domains 4-like [Frankliniella occidentalis]
MEDTDLALGLFPRWWLPNFQRPDISGSRRSGIGDGTAEGHKCSGCGKTYLWRSTLTRHRQYECGVIPPQEGIEKKNTLVLIGLQLLNEKNDYNYWCDRTPDISKMDEETRKMWVDSQGEIVMNDFEPKRRFHNHGVYPCDRCGRTYVRKDSLSRHLQWECGKEPQFQCPFCPQKCKRKSHQLRHIQRQHQDKMHLLTDRDNDLEDLIK